MGINSLFSTKWYAAALVAIIMLYTLFRVFVEQQNSYYENSLIENAQAFLLIISSLVFLLAAVIDKSAFRLFLFMSALVCYAFLLREVDVELIGVIPESIRFFGHGIGRNISVGLALLGLTGYMISRKQDLAPLCVPFVKSPIVKNLIFALIFMLIGALYDRGVVQSTYALLYEELLEVVGYLFVYFAALKSVEYASNHSKI